jgi:hypothetical protein
VEGIKALVATMKADLGLDGLASGCRPLGKVTNAAPLMDWDGKVRPGCELSTP